jgi:hypothetical protein
METQKEPTFEGWAILELMGHRKLAGFVREQQFAGAGMIRVDVPGEQRERGDAVLLAVRAVLHDAVRVRTSRAGSPRTRSRSL